MEEEEADFKGNQDILKSGETPNVFFYSNYYLNEKSVAVKNLGPYFSNYMCQ